MDKLVLPEVIGRVLDELNERYKQPPWMGSVNYQPLQENSSDLLLNCFCVGLGKEREKGTAEVVSMAVGVAKLISNGIQEEITT